jgi:hypothetical protein
MTVQDAQLFRSFCRRREPMAACEPNSLDPYVSVISSELGDRENLIVITF